jgi:tripartite-type tricarboxylate transporter receptor subunit TctC
MKKALWMLAISIVLTLSVAPISYAAGDYPNKPVTIIVPFTPGGLADLTARTFAMSAEKYLGQPLVVANKPGAAGMIGSLAGAQAAPDGYTLTINHSAITGNIESEIAEGRKPPFTRLDFTPIGSFTLTVGCIIVAYDHPWKTIADLVKDCKTTPSHYSYSSSGINGTIWLHTNLFLLDAGIKVRHIPYKGGGDALTAVMGRHADFTIGAISTVRSLAEGRKLRILATGAGKQRIKSPPDTPTLEDFGFYNSNFPVWSGLLLPKKTPEDIVKKLREVAEKVSKDKQFIEAVEKTGDEVYFMNGDTFAKHWNAESEMLAKLYQRLAKEKPSN